MSERTDTYGWPVDNGDVWHLPTAPVRELPEWDPELDATYREDRWGTLARWYTAKARYARQAPVLPGL